SVNHCVLHARLGPGPSEVEAVGVALAQGGDQSWRGGGGGVVFVNLKIGRVGGGVVNDFGIGGAGDGMRVLGLKMLCDRNLLGKKIVLDEDDVEPGPSPAVDNPPHSCKQLPGVEGVRKRGIALEKALEQVDDDDSAAGAHCIVSLPTSL